MEPDYKVYFYLFKEITEQRLKEAELGEMFAEIEREFEHRKTETTVENQD